MRLFTLALTALLAAPTLAAQRTQIVVDAPIPDQPRYSQAMVVAVHLTHSDGTTGIAGTECTPACSVIVSLGAEGGDPAHAIVINPQGFVTDTDGSASARVTFVDGRFGDPSIFTASTTGAPWVVTAEFRGSGAGLTPNNLDCADGAPDGAANGFCPSTGVVPFNLFTETSAISLGLGLEGALGDTLNLSASVADPNGDADIGGTDIDGTAPKPLAGVNVTFFYDQDNNGRPDAAESLGTAVTNDVGVAALDFVLDPQFVRAGTYNTGIHAEFSGDAHFGVARASTQLVVHPAGVDVSRTVVEADPDSIPADGFSKSTIRARLVDAFNNPLDQNSEAHDVVFTTDLGVLQGAVELDPLNGTYTQVLQAQRRPGTATVTVTVDGVVGTFKEVEITGGAGGCHCGDAGEMPAVLAPALMLCLLRRRDTRKTRA